MNLLRAAARGAGAPRCVARLWTAEIEGGPPAKPVLARVSGANVPQSEIAGVCTFFTWLVGAGMTVCMACSLRGWDFSYSERDSEISERRGPKDRAGPVHAVVKPRDLYRGHAKRVDRREGDATCERARY